MKGPDEQALILGALVGLSAATVLIGGLVWAGLRWLST